MTQEPSSKLLLLPCIPAATLPLLPCCCYCSTALSFALVLAFVVGLITGGQWCVGWTRFQVEASINAIDSCFGLVCIDPHMGFSIGKSTLFCKRRKIYKDGLHSFLDFEGLHFDDVLVEVANVWNVYQRRESLRKQMKRKGPFWMKSVTGKDFEGEKEMIGKEYEDNSDQWKERVEKWKSRQEKKGLVSIPNGENDQAEEDDFL